MRNTSRFIEIVGNSLCFLFLIASCPAQGEKDTDFFKWARKLDELDLSINAGDLHLEFSGEMELDWFFFGKESPGISVAEPALRANRYNAKGGIDSPEFGGRLSLFLDGSFKDWLAFFAEFRIDHGTPAAKTTTLNSKDVDPPDSGNSINERFEQYWLRFMIPNSPILNLQLGKFAAPIGNFIPRHYPLANPMTTYPLPYDYVTTFMYKADTPEKVLARRDKPDAKFWRVPIWQAVYAHGAMAFGEIKNLSYAFAVMNSAPGTWPWDWWFEKTDIKNPNWYARLCYRLGFGTKIGASWQLGPYDRDDAVGIPEGQTTSDYPQRTVGVDFEHTEGKFSLFSEYYFTSFRAPLIDNLKLSTWYAEAKYKFTPGFFGAARIGQVLFGKIHDSAGILHRWDNNVTRVEIGAGYFFTRNFFIKATFQVNDQTGGVEADDNMLMTQLVLKF